MKALIILILLGIAGYSVYTLGFEETLGLYIASLCVFLVIVIGSIKEGKK